MNRYVVVDYHMFFLRLLLLKQEHEIVKHFSIEQNNFHP